MTDVGSIWDRLEDKMSAVQWCVLIMFAEAGVICGLISWLRKDRGHFRKLREKIQELRTQIGQMNVQIMRWSRHDD